MKKLAIYAFYFLFSMIGNSVVSFGEQKPLPLAAITAMHMATMTDSNGKSIAPPGTLCTDKERQLNINAAIEKAKEVAVTKGYRDHECKVAATKSIYSGEFTLAVLIKYGVVEERNPAKRVDRSVEALELLRRDGGISGCLARAILICRIE